MMDQWTVRYLEMDMRTNHMIFIVGNSRSGTTMLGRIFGLRSDVHTFTELQFFEKTVTLDEMNTATTWPRDKLVAAAERLMTSAREGLFAKVAAGRYAADAANLIETQQITNPMDLYAAVLAAEAADAEKSIPCEQTPYYLSVSEEILTVFPDARVIHIYRDPRDVLLSQKNRWRRGFLGDKRQPLIWILRSWSNYHPYLTSRMWSSAMRRADTIRGHERFTEIGYEELLTDPENGLRRLCDHAGIEFEEVMLRVPQVGSSSRRDAPERAGLDRSRIGSWRRGGLTKTEIGICESNAAAMMKARDYEPSGARVSLPMRVFMGGTLVMKLGIAFVLNMSRFRNIVSTVRRRA
jgi:hypothetical protein